jgi:N-acetyl-anhydromuramoyl-L-alanine amidase
MTFGEIERFSPNRSDRSHERLGVLFHHSRLGFDQTIDLMLKPESRVSYHCLIHPDGTRCILVPELEVAWHAGVSWFLGRENCNDFLLGVSFAGDTYEAPLTGPQVASALEWLEPRWSALGWDLEHVTDHRQVAPGRKDDLNPVEWDRLLGAIREKFGPRSGQHSFPS